MRLLILTQKVDMHDDVLGFFHSWLLHFSKKFESIVVICLYEGKHNLPENIEVYSLGKEEGASRFKYITRFYKYIISLRNKYDTVFVHMNPEYVVLGGIFWKLWGKKVFQWFNHAKGSVYIKTARFFVENIFSTSKHAFPTRYKKTMLMPAGIDTSMFKNDQKERKSKSILVLGRLSPVKKLHELDPALRILEEADIKFDAHVFGDAPPHDEAYAKKWKESVQDLVERGNLTLHSSVPNHEVPKIYNDYEIYINLTPSGSFDKTILEAMSCGTLPIVSNTSFDEILDAEHIYDQGDSASLASKIKDVFSLPEHEKESRKKKYELYVENNHSIKALLDKLTDALCVR